MFVKTIFIPFYFVCPFLQNIPLFQNDVAYIFVQSVKTIDRILNKVVRLLKINEGVCVMIVIVNVMGIFPYFKMM